jgi:hypothetical protein
MNVAKASPQPLQVSRLSLVAGVLLLGAVTLFIHTQSTWKPTVLSPGVGFALVAFVVAAVAIAAMMRGRIMGESDPARRASLLVTGWAIGEGAGLFGGVVFLLSGQAQWYLIGVLATLGAFALLPARGVGD